MDPNAKSTEEVQPETEKPKTAIADLPRDFADLYHKGVKRMAEAQKSILEFAAKQNAETVAFCKKTLETVPMAPTRPGVFLCELAGEMFDRFIDTQKGILDVIVEQEGALADYLGKSAGDAYNTVTKTFKQSVERGLEVQKDVLNLAAKQHKLAVDTVKKQAGIAGTKAETAADSIQRGVDAVIDTQKELLDIATEQVKTAAAAKA